MSETRPSQFIRPVLLMIAITLLSVGATFWRNAVYRAPETLWEDVIQKSPRKGRAFSALGDHLMRLGNTALAISSYREAISRNPFFSNLYIDLAAAYEQAGNGDEAIRVVQKAISVAESLGERKEKYHLYLGELYYKEMKLSEAAAELLIAGQLDPGDKHVFYQLGLVDRAAGKYDAAVRDFERALALSADEKEREECRTYLDEVQTLRQRKAGQEKHNAAM